MKKQIHKINLTYMLSYLGDALFSPFLALYFSSLSIDELKKGILLALIPLSSLVGNLFYGKLSKNSQRNLLIARVLIIFNILPMLFMGLIKNYYLVGLMTIVFSLHNNPFFSFQDGVTVNISTYEKTIYANTRLFGTIGYFIGSLLGGYLIDLTNFSLVFIIAGIIYSIVELMFFFIKPVDDDLKIKDKITFSQVFKHRYYIYYLIFYILVLGTWNVQEAYVSIMFKQMGMSTSNWGYLYAYEIAIEAIILFLLCKYLKKKGRYSLVLFVSISLMSFRGLILSINLDMWSKAIISASLRGLAWGGFLSSHIEMVKKILDSSLVTKAVVIFSVCANLYVSLGNYLAPYIYQNLSFNYFYLILFFIQIIGLFILLLTISKIKKNVCKNF